MYDPEEACNENEATKSVKEDGQEQEGVEVDEASTTVKEEAQGLEVKTETADEDEEETKLTANSPRTRRAGITKNGTTGPKAKRGRK